MGWVHAVLDVERARGGRAGCGGMFGQVRGGLRPGGAGSSINSTLDCLPSTKDVDHTQQQYCSGSARGGLSVQLGCTRLARSAGAFTTLWLQLGEVIRGLGRLGRGREMIAVGAPTTVCPPAQLQRCDTA